MKLTKLFLLTTALCSSVASYAAGTISPKGGLDPLRIKDHHVDVLILDGFARVEVTQTFENQHSQVVEGKYKFPLPESATLSETKVMTGEQVIEGEVVEKSEADRIYEEEKNSGNSVAKSEKNGYQDFTFSVANIPANATTTVSFVYYQPLKIDLGMGRFQYPQEEGGTDEVQESFWTMNDEVDGMMSMDVKIRTAAPLSGIRTPGFQALNESGDLSQGQLEQRYEIKGAKLNQDFVLYYRLAENMPGRVEVIPYKPSKDEPGTFMMTVTPGVDLAPLNQGHDYLFVLDISGSMQAKIHTLADAVVKAIGRMKAGDRFRVYTFNTRCDEVTNGWIDVSEASVQRWAAEVQKLRSDGGTNMYEGIYTGLKGLDADRVSSVILVTDAVANAGELRPEKFAKLLTQQDIRFFGFLLGNSSNWPLMRLMCETSGGFYDTISNSDDIVGKVLQAKEKVAYEAIHNASLDIDGVKTFDETGKVYKKVYRGQQMTVFGRYKSGGKAEFEMTCKISGQEQTYRCEFELPDVDTDYPELERLWAMKRVEEIETLRDLGLFEEDEAKDAVKSLGVDYQIVTDETSMLVMSDDRFAAHNIDRKNRERITREHTAQSQRAAQPVRNHTVSNNSGNSPTFPRRAPRIGGGGGALSPFTVMALLAMLGLGSFAVKRKED